MNDLLAVDDNDFYSFDEEEILLTEKQIAEAVSISERVTDRELQWQVYLSSLALAGFTSWLDERDDELKIDTSECPLLTGSPKIGAASRLQIGGFKVCVIAKGGLDGDYVNIPQAILKDSAETAQFYVFVEVLEEMSQAVMYGFLRSDRFDRYAQAEPLEDFSDGTCDLPVSWLNLEFDELVSYLRCFNPNAIPLPKLVPAESIGESTTSSLESIENLVINTSQWFNRQLDRVSESLNAVMLSSSFAASGMRSEEELSIRERVNEHEGHEIVPNDSIEVKYPIGDYTLHILTWKSPDDFDRWGILAAVSSQKRLELPIGLSIEIDENGNFSKRSIEEEDRVILYEYVVFKNDSNEGEISISIATLTEKLFSETFTSDFLK
jgi:Protein of unknown function (DUF1822)